MASDATIGAETAGSGTPGNDPSSAPAKAITSTPPRASRAPLPSNPIAEAAAASRGTGASGAPGHSGGPVKGLSGSSAVMRGTPPRDGRKGGGPGVGGSPVPAGGPVEVPRPRGVAGGSVLAPSAADGGLSFHAAVATIQAHHARFSADRQSWDTARGVLEQRCAMLEAENASKEALNSSLLKRIAMLEFALKQERRRYAEAIGAGSKAGQPENGAGAGGAAVESIGEAPSGIVPPPTPDPAMLANAGKPRASRQLVEQLLASLGAHAQSSMASHGDLSGSMAEVPATAKAGGASTPKDGTPGAAMLALRSGIGPLNFKVKSTNGRGSLGGGGALKVLRRRPGHVEPLPDRRGALPATLPLGEQPGPQLNNDKKGGVDGHNDGDGLESGGSMSDASSVASDASTGSSLLAVPNPAGGPPIKMAGLIAQVADATASDQLDSVIADAVVHAPVAEPASQPPPKAVRIWSGPERGSRKVWKPRLSLRNHMDAVRCMAWHKSNLLLLSGSDDCTLKVWNLKQLSRPGSSRRSNDVEPLRTFRGHTGPVNAAVVLDDFNVAGKMPSSFAVSGGEDGQVLLWQMPSLASPSSYGVSAADSFPKRTLAKFDAPVLALAQSTAAQAAGIHVRSSGGPAANAIYALCKDGKLRVIRISGTETYGEVVEISSEELFSVDGETLSSVAADPTSPCLTCFVGGSKGSTVKLNTETKTMVWSCAAASQNAVTQIAAHGTLPVVAVGYVTGDMSLFNSDGGDIIRTVRVHGRSVAGVEFDAMGMFVATTSADGAIRVWAVDDGACLWDLNAHRAKWSEAGLCVRFHASSGTLASCGADAVIKIYT